MDPNIFVKIKTGKRTKGHDFKIVKGQSRLDVRKYSFSQRTANEWKKLSADGVHSTTSSINMHKDRIDNYLVTARLVGSHWSCCLGDLVILHVTCLSPTAQNHKTYVPRLSLLLE